MRLSVILTLLVSLFCIQCSYTYSRPVVWDDRKIPGERSIILDAGRAGWIGYFERDLMRNGYKIVRSEYVGRDHPRVHVTIHGSAMECIGTSNYWIEDLYIEVIDTDDNTVLASYEDRGEYGYRCDIHSDITFKKAYLLIDSIWQTKQEYKPKPKPVIKDSTPVFAPRVF